MHVLLIASLFAIAWMGVSRCCIEEKRDSSSNPLFVPAYVVWLITAILGISAFAPFVHVNVTSFGCVCALCAGELMRGSHDRVALAAAVCFLLLLVACNARMLTLAAAIVFIYCSHGMSFVRLSRISLFIVSLTCAFIVFCGACGVIENYVSSGVRQREFLGFLYALFLPQYVFMCTCLVVSLFRRRLRVLHMVVLLVANVASFALTDSRLSFGLSVAVLAGAALVKSGVRIDRGVLGIALAFSFVLCAAVGIGLSACYDSSVAWHAELNSALGARLALGNAALNEYGVPLLGQQLEFVGGGLDMHGELADGEYNYVDCLYVRLLVQLGPIGLVAFVSLFSALALKVRRAGNPWLLIALAAIAVHCLLDDLSLFLYFNPFLLAVGTTLIGVRACKRSGTSLLPDTFSSCVFGVGVIRSTRREPPLGFVGR